MYEMQITICRKHNPKNYYCRLNILGFFMFTDFLLLWRWLSVVWPRYCDPLGIVERERSQWKAVVEGWLWGIVIKPNVVPVEIRFYNYQCFNIILNILLVSIIPVITFDIHQEPLCIAIETTFLIVGYRDNSFLHLFILSTYHG